MSIPAIFNFEDLPVRVINSDIDDLFFVAVDVADALGYKNKKQAIKDHCMGVVQHAPLQTAGGIQKVRIIDEENFYRLIFSSRLETAKRFQSWVFQEVLPQIRKTGQYTLHAGLTPEQQRLAQNAVAKLHGATGETFQAIWSSVKDQFKVGTYKDIPTGQFDELMLFLKSPPKPKAISDKVGNMHRTDYCAAWLDIAAERYKKLRAINDNLYDMSFGQIRGELGRVVAELYDSIHEPKFAIARIDRNQIESKTKRMLGNQRMGG